MPLKQARFEAQGRPRPSRRRRGSGKNSSIRFHSSLGKLMLAVSPTRLCNVSTLLEAESIYETISTSLIWKN